MNNIKYSFIDKIKGIKTNSKEVVPGDLFVAFKGQFRNGNEFINEAIDNGAVVVLHESEMISKKSGIIYLKSENIFEDYQNIVDLFYEKPYEKIELIGITGTNGKTSTAWIINDFLSQKELTAYVGTLGLKKKDKLIPGKHTTEFFHDFNDILKHLVDEDYKKVVLEVSSHGLDQKRVDRFKFQYTIMTNLTHEHLDYHKTMEDYLNAKSKLFSMTTDTGKIILNKDDNSYDTLKKLTNNNCITYAIDTDADIIAENIKLSLRGTEFTLNYFGEKIDIKSPLIGKFNIHNLLAAIAVVGDLGFSLKEIQNISAKLEPINGRMEIINFPNNIDVIVDYSHTPDGIEKVLQFVNEVKKERNNVVSIFGSAGQRDIFKRPIIGGITAKYSTHLIITEDDPRDEDVIKISQEIVNGLDVDKTNIDIIPDREKALVTAIENSQKNDVIICFSKGREQFMYRDNGKEYYEGDFQIVSKLLNKK